MSPTRSAVLGAVPVLLAAAAARGAAQAWRRRGVARRLAGAGDGPGVLRAAVLPPPAWLPARLAAAAVPVDPAVGWTGWLALSAVLVALAAAAGPALAVVALAASAGLPAVALVVLGGRGDRALEAALPESLEGVARSLRSGGSLRQAVGEAAGSVGGVLAHDLSRVAAEVAAGAPLASALGAWEQRRPLPGVRLAVAALALGAETGGAHARAVDGVAETLRSRLAVAGEVRALSSQARASALVIVLAPLCFSGFAAVTDERTAAFLFRTPLGLLCLLGGLALDTTGAVWMHRLSRVDP